MKQLVLLLHATPSTGMYVDFAGFGVDLVDQALPFPLSASVFVWFALLPTAMQKDEVAQATPESIGYPELAGLGTEMIDQIVPFHRSASVCPPDAPADAPTA
jgi:hypothetical protein